MKKMVKDCKKCGDDITYTAVNIQEFELISSTQNFCSKCWKAIPDHIPHIQRLMYLGGVLQ